MCVAGGKLCFVAKGGLRLVLRSRTEIEAALRECHDDPGTGGHRGVTVTNWRSRTTGLRWQKM